MSTINTLLIKRRLPTVGALAGKPAALSGGELAYNEVDNILYYGASGYDALNGYNDGVVPIGIAGTGLFVDRVTNQSISGEKTFWNTTRFNDQVYINANLDVRDTIEANEYTINGTTVIDSTSAAFFSNARLTGDLTVFGNLSVLGNQTQVDTLVTVTSSFEILNAGTSAALKVTQTGSTDIAEFYDDLNTALIIKDGGNVGINTNNPNEKLTVSGNISASGDIYGYNAYLSGALTVDGATTLRSTLSTIDAVNFASTFDVAGVTTLSSQLTVKDATTLQSTLSVAGATTLNSSLSTTGAVDFDSTFSLAGAATLDTTLYVNQLVTFNANLSGNVGVSQIIDFIIDGGSF
jgi:hypothetical protein